MQPSTEHAESANLTSLPPLPRLENSLVNMDITNGGGAPVVAVPLAEAPAKADAQNGEHLEDSAAFKLKFCTVCASNQNR